MNTPPRLSLSRRQGLRALALLGLGASGVAPARVAGKTLPLSASLPDELARALKARQPLVVMVSLHRCPWCEEVRNNYLAPMRAQERLPVVQVDMLSPRQTRDLQGAPTTHEALVRAWDVKVAPTVLFLGPQGKEVADRLVGGSPDFYSAYLDRRLALAREAVIT
ncbi:MAG TPA: hypothetical protein PKE22_08725 [Ottowia sp.]|jgi:hypothetical protein|nr:hypothetical protein [Ottowia sp.]HMT64919.1 hypothetical protein [Ottowia sp.]HMT83818.1 hypothetical protein [Ottowia sp.]HOK10646.1 hypothetical protein [Ottowia sp.]HOM20328.1 hypothetical protein [Ottowia sp.]